MLLAKINGREITQYPYFLSQLRQDLHEAEIDFHRQPLDANAEEEDSKQTRFVSSGALHDIVSERPLPDCECAVRVCSISYAAGQLQPPVDRGGHRSGGNQQECTIVL